MFRDMNFKAGLWLKCRFAFRCCRFTVWAAVLLLLAAFAWLNIVGLPNFAKIRLVAALHERGVDLEFTRMRLGLIRGFICDNVRIGQAHDAGGAVLTARQVQLRVDFMALLHRKLQVDSLVLREGDFNFPLADDDSLALTNLESELRFEANDTWSLDQFRADFAGASITLGGEVAHAPEFRHWKMFATAKNADRGSVQSSLKNLSDTLKKIHFDGKPQLSARLDGDAHDVRSFSFTINTRTPAVDTPWFSVRDLQFAAHVLVSSNAFIQSDPAWGFWTNLQPFNLEWTAHGADLKLARLDVDMVDCKGSWSAPQLAVTNLSAHLGGGELDGSAKLDVATRAVEFTVNSSFDLHAVAPLLTGKIRERLADVSWSEPPHVQASGALVLPAWTNRAPDWQAEIEPSLSLRGELAFTNVLVSGVAAVDSAYTHFSCEKLKWSLPDLHVTQGDTALDLHGEEDDGTKDFHCGLSGKLDGHSIRPYLTTSNAVHGFEHFSFRDPAVLTLDVIGNLRDFHTLSATGAVAATNFAIRGQWVDSLATTLTYTNLKAEFYHPQISRAQGAEVMKADRVTLDIKGPNLYIHGGAGRLSLAALGGAIGPKTARNMAPYQFLTLPYATAEGCIPLKQINGDLVPKDADLWVHIVGTVPFRWMKFQTPSITGDLHWLSNFLIITNVVSECYGGAAQGWGRFDVQTPGDGTDLSFFVQGTNVDFNAMGRALWSPTNRLRGLLDGTVTVTRANSSNWRTWNGFGQMEVRNGLLWDAPILGMMSPVLNTLTPGLDVGNSRATEGAGHFTMADGVIYTDSLEIRSLTMRLQYVGTVDLRENVAARARAQLLRNTPLVGSLFSTVLWPVSKVFECEITGTLEKPKITPAYIPFANLLTAPLHPFRTMEELFATPPINNSTN